MDDIRYFKPKTGLPVGDPQTDQFLPAHGKGLPWNSFWERRLNDGDIEPTTEEAIAAAEKAAAKSAKAQGDEK